NETLFNVSYGTPSISFTFPNFRVLANQSFNLTAKVMATEGDIINPVLILNFTNDSMMNISYGETYTKNSITNITNGSYVLFLWNSTTNEIGLLRASINVTTHDSTSLEYDTPYGVLLPITSASPYETNITGTETFTVKIVGNTTNIVAANFTAEKPYSGGSEFFSGKLMAVEEETTCVGIGGETGNVAIDANTSCSGGTCALAVDNSTDTAWLQNTQYKWITINLSQSYTIDAIEIVWSGTETNTSIYYIHSGATDVSSDNVWRPFNDFMYQDAPTETNTTLVKASVPFTTDTLIINDSSSAPSGIQIYEVRIYPVLGSVDKCYIYEANYTSLNYSGTHLVSSTVTTQSSTGDILSNSSFFVEFGTPVITKGATFEEYPKVSTSYIYEFDVYAEGGDLRDINATLFMFNDTLINFTTEENISQNILFIAHSNTNSVSWNLTTGSIGDKTTNISVFANSSSGLGGSDYEDANVTVIYADSEAPVIHWFSISQNKTNLYHGVTVTVNVSDNIQVRNVTAEVTAPEFSFNTTNSTDWKAEGLWTILIDSDLINQTGNYSVKVHATDVGNNLSSSQNNTNFTTYDTYTISLSTNYSA
ncbi:MAG: discoidin domain-containing protein, partial [Candidatus Aenigmarchaeota archaeon]|nr:discoidin domain-containing protein [Candidatus Aenigmarchaeota archaeon]